MQSFKSLWKKIIKNWCTPYGGFKRGDITVDISISISIQAIVTIACTTTTAIIVHAVLSYIAYNEKN